MAEIRLATPLGALHVHGWSPPTMQAAAELGLELARAGVRRGELTSFAGHDVYLKAGPLGGKARLRHGSAAWLLRRRWPRVREYENLSWLIERHFQAVLPLAAGVLLRRGLPRFQFLITTALREGQPLDAFLSQAPAPERARILAELARETGRMHALGFLHHDLYPRNLLVLGPRHPRRVVFLDAWAGGPPIQLRGPAYDLGCFFLEGAELLEPAEQRTFLEDYLAEREVQEQPAHPRRLLAATARTRAALRRQLERDPARLRGRPLPRAIWP